MSTSFNYQSPPIQEVSYSFQFEPLSNLHAGYIGMLWGDKFNSDYPDMEYDNILPHDIERFGANASHKPMLSFRMVQSATLPRVRITSPDKATLLQIQNDKFVFNWRKLFDDKLIYPRYEKLKSQFKDELDKFRNFLSDKQLGDLQFNQVSVIYVNHIPVSGRSFSDIFRGLSVNENLNNNLRSESFVVQMSHVIYLEDEPVGRLYTNITKTNLVTDNSEIFVLQFDARANPKTTSEESAFETMNLLREHINSSFDNLTSLDMHKVWGKE